MNDCTLNFSVSVSAAEVRAIFAILAGTAPTARVPVSQDAPSAPPDAPVASEPVDAPASTEAPATKRGRGRPKKETASAAALAAMPTAAAEPVVCSAEALQTLGREIIVKIGPHAAKATILALGVDSIVKLTPEQRAAVAATWRKQVAEHDAATGGQTGDDLEMLS